MTHGSRGNHGGAGPQHAGQTGSLDDLEAPRRRRDPSPGRQSIDAVSSVSAWILARISCAIHVAEAIPLRFSVTSRYASSSDNGSIRGVFGKDVPDLKRDRPINLKARLNEDQIRAPPL